jgi:hypothetical protein
MTRASGVPRQIYRVLRPVAQGLVDTNQLHWAPSGLFIILPNQLASISHFGDHFGDHFDPPSGPSTHKKMLRFSQYELPRPEVMWRGGLPAAPGLP